MTAPAAPAPAWNPLAPGFFANPYPHYAALREQDPVHATPFGPFVVTRHGDVIRVLRDSTLSVVDDPAQPSPALALIEKLRVEMGDTEPLQPSMLALDPPDHTRLRRLVQRSFTPRAIARMTDVVERLTDELLDRLAAGPGTADLLSELAFPLPFAVICELLGLPAGDRDELRSWSRALTQLLEPVVTVDQGRAGIEARLAVRAYLREAIARKRVDPADDLMSELVAVEEEGDRLSEEELVTMLTLLFVAGHETTVNLIGNGVIALLRHPEQLSLLRGDPSLDANAVDELLRYDSPVQHSGRRTLVDITFEGVAIPARTLVLTSLGAANRDPAVFGDDADTVDLTRANAADHLSFGSGVHVCLGAALARLEGATAIGRLVRRFPGLALATDELDWAPRVILRGVTALPVRLR